MDKQNLQLGATILMIILVMSNLLLISYMFTGDPQHLLSMLVILVLLMPLVYIGLLVAAIMND